MARNTKKTQMAMIISFTGILLLVNVVAKLSSVKFKILNDLLIGEQSGQLKE